MINARKATPSAELIASFPLDGTKWNFVFPIVKRSMFLSLVTCSGVWTHWFIVTLQRVGTCYFEQSPIKIWQSTTHQSTKQVTKYELKNELSPFVRFESFHKRRPVWFVNACNFSNVIFSVPNIFAELPNKVCYCAGVRHSDFLEFVLSHIS